MPQSDLKHLPHIIPDPNNEPSDFVLRPGVTSAWITVDNLSVYLHRTDEGVCVDIYPKGNEDMDTMNLGSTWVLFNEAKEGE